ncbi:MAG: RNA-binding domain-containing protein [Thermoprotei archaeon]
MARVRNVSLSAICYATEDIAKVVKSLGTLLGATIQTTRISTNRAEGHYGDEITLVNINLENKEAEDCAKRIFSSLDKQVIDLILSTANLRFDGSKLFLRFSKFDAYVGRIVLGEGGDSIKVVIAFSGYLKGKTYYNIFREAGLIGESYA